MGEEKNPKNWYIRMKEDFFDTKEIKLIKNMPNGKDYIILLLQLRLLTINTKGKLQFSDVIPYNDKMISDLTNTNIDIVRSGMRVLQDLNFITMLDDGVLYMEEVEKLIGYTSKDAEAKAKYRAKIKAESQILLGHDEGQSPGQCPTIDIDIDIAIDIDKYIDKKCISVSVSKDDILELFDRFKIGKELQIKVVDYISAGMDLDVIENALMIPFNRNVMNFDFDEQEAPINNPEAYSETILEKWNAFGVKTLSDAKKYNKLLKSKKD